MGRASRDSHRGSRPCKSKGDLASNSPAAAGDYSYLTEEIKSAPNLGRSRPVLYLGDQELGRQRREPCATLSPRE